MQTCTDIPTQLRETIFSCHFLPFSPTYHPLSYSSRGSSRLPVVLWWKQTKNTALLKGESPCQECLGSVLSVTWGLRQLQRYPLNTAKTWQMVTKSSPAAVFEWKHTSRLQSDHIKQHHVWLRCQSILPCEITFSGSFFQFTKGIITKHPINNNNTS